ncbi:MAG: hypothetical protein ACW990_16710, partial [Promethearchaeota archaeon]
GERGSNEEQAYGITDKDVTNLNVIITKLSDNIVLFNSTTNHTRHYSQVIDISPIMNNNSLNYYGEYVIKVCDVNGKVIPGCLLEKFELDFSRSLDPTCSDFDSDSIMDGVEMDLLVRGIEKIDIRDFYNCSFEGKPLADEHTNINEFTLEVSDVGVVYDAELTLKIVSEDVSSPAGNISVSIFKQNNNFSIEDTSILSIFEEFTHLTGFIYETKLNLTKVIEKGKMREYAGEYVLQVELHGIDNTTIFYISEYFIETDTFIQAGLQDSQAWLTDPALEDSDFDGWSDSYEIFESGTNPLNKDQDGDKAWDSLDWDPFRNVLLEIRPINATFANQIWPNPNPFLEIIIRTEINDLMDPDFSEDTSNLVFCTTSQPASTVETWWSDEDQRVYQTAWWNEGVGHRYFIDINDDINIQSDTISFYFQLWQMVSTGDVPLFRGSWIEATYSISEVGHSEQLKVEKVGLQGRPNTIVCEVETIAVDRANTIAVFDPNATLFNGHFQEQERMNLIQLYITEDGHFPASVSFENETSGSTPNEWRNKEEWVDTSNIEHSPTILNEVDGHNKVLEINDMSSSRRGYLTHLWNSSYSIGQLEVWVRLSSATRRSYLIIMDETSSDSILLRFDITGNIQYGSGSNYYKIAPYAANVWYHLRFKWDCSDDWQLYINGVSQHIPDDSDLPFKKGFEFYGAPSAMDRLNFQTDVSSADYSFYVDAIGYSFDEFYSMGDNMVRSDTTGTPFVPGLNAIVIPTSLFSNTLLNSYLQSEELNRTPLYTEQKGLFEFYSVDRDGMITDDQCGDTDFVFVRYGITAQDAMKILNSLLICAINQSEGENNATITTLAKLYEYSSTKINGTYAVSMNLPSGMLSFVSWVSESTNSPYGLPPETLSYLGLLISGLLTLLGLVTGMLLFVSTSVMLLTKIFGDVIKEIGLTILTFLAKLLWILIRVALLILFYVLLAIELLTTSLLFAPIGLILWGLSGLMGISSSWGLNWCVEYGVDTRIGHISIGIGDAVISIESWVNWIYWEFFDLYIPLPDLDIDITSALFTTSETPEPPSLHCGYNQVGDPDSTVFNFFTTYQDLNADKADYVRLILLAPNGTECSYYMVSETENDQENAWLMGKQYNITINFENKLEGQWFYY